MGANLMIVRGEDLLILGVGWTGLTLDPGPAGPRLLAGDSGGTVELVLPSQAIAEQRDDDTGDPSLLRAARTGGPSRIVFPVAPGAAVPLAVEGLLTALRTVDPEASAIELPWRLVVAPRARGPVLSDHPTRPVSSPEGVSGLWRARLQSVEATATDAVLTLALRQALPDDAELGSSTGPLTATQRQDLVTVSSAPDWADGVRRLELSALGGSLSVSGSRPGTAWEHETVLGRDQRVRIEQRGVLYPFGHRATLTTLCERAVLAASGDGDHGSAVLQNSTSLTVAEPLRRPSGAPDLTRRFPFTEVEILAPVVPDLAFADLETVPRPLAPTGPVADELAATVAERDALVASVNARIAELPGDVYAYIAAGWGSAPALQAAQEARAACGDPEAMKDAQRSIGAQVDAIWAQVGESYPYEQAQADVDALMSGYPSNEEIYAASVCIAQTDPQVSGLWAAVTGEFAALPRSFEAMVAAGDDEAVRARALDEPIAARRRVLDDIAAATAAPPGVLLVPHDRQGTPVRFPLRCRGVLGDVHLTTPLIFVRDEVFPPIENVAPAFDPLTDATVLDVLADRWSAVGELTLPGVAVDLVRSARPQPADVHEVHALGVGVRPRGRELFPVLESVTAALPGLRALLPDRVETVALAYTGRYLEQADRAVTDIVGEEVLAAAGDIEDVVDVALAPLGDALGVDFTADPLRAGGLAAPKFLVDGISRTLGPVPVGALPVGALPGPGGLPDLAAIYQGATLLGVDLPSLVRLATGSVPAPPAILDRLVDGLPVVTMTWDVDLDSHGPFRAGPASRLHLEVELAADRQVSTSRVDDIALAFPPPPATSLLRLGFRAVTVVAEQGRPARLHLDGLQVDLDGALALLTPLRDALVAFLGPAADRAPEVREVPGGVVASYALGVPSLSFGVLALRDLGIRVALTVPFDRRPVSASLSFATRDHPFHLTVLGLGGVGWVEVDLDPGGITRLDASLGFEAMLAVDFLIARGEVHAAGGLIFSQQGGGGIAFFAYLRFGGSLEILGLVSVAVELMLTLAYRPSPRRLEGRASIVIDVDLTLYSDTFRIDSGPWVIDAQDPAPDDPMTVTTFAAPVSQPAPLPSPADLRRASWQDYRKAFAPR